MRFQITKKGRTLFLDKDDLKACRGCGKQTSLGDKWYYYDEPFSKGLYCRLCVINDLLSVSTSDKGKKYQAWAIDHFREGED